MSIYDENKFSFPAVRVSFGQFKYPLLAVAALIVILSGLFTVWEFLKPVQLSTSLNPNPLDLTNPTESSTMLNVIVSNTKGETVSGVLVMVEEVGGSNLILFPLSRRIDSMAPHTMRELKQFVIRPNPNKEINSGSYRIRVSLFIDGKKEAVEDLTLIIKAV